MKNYSKIVSMERSEWNHVFYACVKNHDTGKLKNLLQNGAPLTVFCLMLMDVFGYDRSIIKSIIMQSEKIDDMDIFYWMKDYFDSDDLVEVLIKFEDCIPKGYLSDEDLLKFHLYSALLKDKKFDLLYLNAPKFLEDTARKRLKDTSSDAIRVLLEKNFDKYVDLAFEQGYFGLIMLGGDMTGIKYLVDKGKVDFVLERMTNRFSADLFNVKEALEYCYEKGFKEELYEYEFYDLLLQHDEKDLFIKYKSTFPAFLNKYPADVDWETLWQEADDCIKQDLLKIARQHKDIPECVKFLWNHSGWFEKIKLLGK